MQSNFIVYNASAGSGKTYTITREYLSILFNASNPFNFQNILAITFTNKAASEMKTRVLNALIGFSGCDRALLDKNLLNDVVSHTGLSVEDIEKKSLVILKLLLSNYADFEISTIDSFNHRIIRTFARDLRISQNFSIQLDADDYLSQAVDHLIDDIGQDDDLTKWLTDFVRYKIENDTSGDIRYALLDYSKLVLNETNYKYLSELQSMSLADFKVAKNKINQKLAKLLKDLEELDNAFHELIQTQGIEEKSFPRAYIPGYFKNVRINKFRHQYPFTLEDVPGIQLYNKTTKQSQKDSIEEVRPAIEELLNKLLIISTEYEITKRVQKSLTPLAMISQIQQKLNALKAEEEVLFTMDFNKLIGNQVAQQPAPFIYERLGEKFRHYFIDEFQDTSRLQWKNIIPLVEHALTSEDPMSNDSHLYLVGDVKQSIYEWRGGDARLLLDLYLGTSENPFSIASEIEELDKIWRSGKAIVEFNNQFFKYASDYLSDPRHRSIYQKVVQQYTKENEGYVELNFLDKDLEKEDLLEERINQLVSYIQTSQDQGYRLSDICILVRTNRYGVEIAEALNSLDEPIPVVSQESLLLKNDQKIEILHLFLRLVTAYTEELKVDFLLKWSTYKNLNAAEIDPFITEFTKSEALEFFTLLEPYGISFNVNTYNNLPFYNRFEYLVQSLGFAKDSNAYLQFYLDEVLHFSRTRSKDVHDFLEHWENKKDKLSISTSETSNAVNIMTIHKSKGLQFPVVIYAYANFNLSYLDKVYDWIPLDEQDYGIPVTYQRISNAVSTLNEDYKLAFERNVRKTELANMNAAYVCMTRAEDQLYVLVDPPRDKKNLDLRTLLTNYLSSKNRYLEGQTVYQFGTKKPVKTKETKEQASFYSSLSSCNSARFLNTLTPGQDSQVFSFEIDYGVRLHEALEQIDYSATYRDAPFANDFQKEIFQILNNEQLKPYYAKPWQIFNEVEIAYNYTLHRIDRLCVKDKDAVIIDYKTGVESQKDIQQITNYKKAIESLGYTNIKAYLVYIRKSILVKPI